jgi:multidrug efflux pump
VLGLRAGFDLNVRQFPEVRNAVVSVSTTYIGADADLVQGFITTPLEREVAAAEGIDYIVSTSTAGVRTISSPGPVFLTLAKFTFAGRKGAACVCC